MDATKKIPSNQYKLPKFQIEDLEDMYTYYVHILNISEEVFWDADFSFLISVVENKTAYDGFINYLKYKQTEELSKKNR